MATQKHLVDLAVRYQVILERAKTGILEDTEQLVKDVMRAINDIVFSLEHTSIDEVTKTELKKILADLRVAHTNLLLDYNDELVTDFTKIAVASSEYEMKSLEQSIADVVIVAPTAEQLYREARNRPLSVNGQLLDDFIKTWSRREVQLVSNTITKGYTDGLTNQQMITSIRGTRANNYKDGLGAKLAKDAEAVVRTAVQHVSQAARYKTWAVNADIVEGYVWLSTLDQRTTQQCRSLDGRTFKLGDGPLPPIHVRCRSTTVADINDRYDFLDEGGTRSSSRGPVSSEQDYYDWLLDQPAEFQDTAIGPTRGKLLREGGLTADEFARLNISRTFQPLTLEQMRNIDPGAFDKAGL